MNDYLPIIGWHVVNMKNQSFLSSLSSLWWAVQSFRLHRKRPHLRWWLVTEPLDGLLTEVSFAGAFFSHKVSVWRNMYTAPSLSPNYYSHHLMVRTDITLGGNGYWLGTWMGADFTAIISIMPLWKLRVSVFENVPQKLTIVANVLKTHPL